MFRVVGVLGVILGIIAGVTLVFYPFYSNDVYKIFGLWGLFIIGFLGGIYIYSIGVKEEIENYFELASNVTIVLGFSAGIAIFLEIMNWIFTRGLDGYTSLWFQFILCTLGSILLLQQGRDS